jgi:type IV secretory pathway TrbL component
MVRTNTLAVAALIAATAAFGAANAAPPGAPAGSAAGGTGGSAAAGGTSASTLGLGATTTGPSGTESAIGTGGSAAGGTHDTTQSHVNGNADNLHGVSRAQAQDGGTWSHSMTHTRVHQGDIISRTKSMSHEPGGPPSKSTSTIDTGAAPQ